ncbi:prephenate dehydratase domain-containing protein [Buchnera aphidicola]|uniref:prephenate dehydratase domain-containing protein n=1 Tax=Buchnera aphidicola TaxID=9 RepID=UPI0034642203
MAFLGPKGSYSYLAALKYSKKKCKILHEVPCKTFKEVIKKINKKNVYAILPIKNKISGIIKETNNIIKKNKIYILEKIKIAIKHCLVSKKKISLKNINIIYSHAQPIKQCQLFIKNYPFWKIKYTKSSSQAMEIVSKNKRNNIAAIGNKKCSSLYNLYIIKKNISNNIYNKTLFYVLFKK